MKDVYRNPAAERRTCRKRVGNATQCSIAEVSCDCAQVIELYMYTNIRQDATVVSWFNCKITLHVSGTLSAHHQEHNNCS
jgi:hypothetical protein